MKRKVSCVILCGGRGTRMGHKTEKLPKPLAEVSGKPILQHILGKLDGFGFDRIVLATGYLSSTIEARVPEFNAEIKTEIGVNDTGEGTAMLARLVQCRDMVSEYVVVCYGDTFIDLDLQTLVEDHVKEERLVTIVTGRITNPFGILKLDAASQTVRSFVEKPTYDYYIGCFVFQKSLFDHATDAMLEMPDGKGLVSLFDTLIDQGKLHYHRYDGMQVTFNTESERQDAEKSLNNYYTISNE